MKSKIQEEIQEKVDRLNSIHKFIRHGNRKVQLNIDIFNIIIEVIKESKKYSIIRWPCIRKWIANNIANKIAKRVEKEIGFEITRVQNIYRSDVFVKDDTTNGRS